MDGSSESFQISGTSSSPGVIGGAVGGVSRESSSGASSDTVQAQRRLRRASGSPYPQRPPRADTPRMIQDEVPMTVADGLAVASPSETSSLPPLEPPLVEPGEHDTSRFDHTSSPGSRHLHTHSHRSLNMETHSMDVDQRSVHHTVNMDQRSVNVDQRSVMVNQIDPVVISEACQAVSRAQSEASQVQSQLEVQRIQAMAQIELTQAQARSEVQQAQNETEVTRHQAMGEIQNLRGQLGASSLAAQAQIGELQRANDQILSMKTMLDESSYRERLLNAQVSALGEEIKRMKTLVGSSASGSNVPVGSMNPYSSPNGTDLLLARMIALEERMKVLEDQMADHSTYIQELWNHEPQSRPKDSSSKAKPKSPVHFHIGDDDKDGEAKQGDTEDDENDSYEDLESKVMRTKDLHHLKLPSLPESAAQYRTWRNSTRTSILAYDMSPHGLLTPSFTKAFTARGDEAKRLINDSEGFPRFDRVIASVLCKPEVLKSSFGLKVQSYVERCEMEGECIRGRVIINLVSTEFDTSHASTSITSSLELFQLPSPQDNAAGLRHWADKVTYVLSQLPVADRPQASLMSQWAYNSLKKHPLLRRTIDQYVERPSLRSFEYLWEGVELALRESQYDSNAQSIRDDLRKGPNSPKKDPKAMVAKGSQPKGKGKKDQGSAPKGSPKGKGTKGPNDPKSDSGKQTPNPKVKPSNSSNPPPCIFFQRGKCTRTNCPFAHTAGGGAATTGTPAAKSSPSPKAKAAAAMVALVTGLGCVGVVEGHSPVLGMSGGVDSAHSGYVEFIGDTGAGESLGSRSALQRQGFMVPDHYFTQTQSPLKFSTGGGAQPGSQTVGCWSDVFSQMQNVYMLESCPLALSIGSLVQNEGYSFVWPSNGIPFLAPPECKFSFALESEPLYANRVDHNVPIFRFPATFVPGLTASVAATPGGDTHMRERTNPRMHHQVQRVMKLWMVKELMRIVPMFQNWMNCWTFQST